MALDLSRDAVDTPCLEWARMYQDWDLIHDLLGGTGAMQKRGERWLPREPREEYEAYRIRLSRSMLYNMFGNTVKRLISKPFGRPVTIEDAPEWLEPILKNVDLQGTSITQFIRDVFRTGLIYGMAHVFVDYPKTDRNASRAVEATLGVRPYLRHIMPSQLISWQNEAMPNGAQRLTEIRFREISYETIGQYRQQRVHWMYVYYIDENDVINVEVWRSDDPDTTYDLANVNYFQTPEIERRRTWTMVEEGTIDFAIDGVPTIPLRTIYFNRTGFMTAEPPLNDLATVNLTHWQSMSDQRNILRYSRLAQLFAKGFSDEDMKKNQSIAVNRVWRATDPQADLKYVEHTGQSIGAGAEDLLRLEAQGEQLGMQPARERTRDQTATGIVVNESRNTNDLLAWVDVTETNFKVIMEMMAIWLNAELPESFRLSIYSDFATGISAGEDFKQVLEMRAAKDITRVLAIKEAVRRGILDESVDPKEEALAARDEAGEELGGPLPNDDNHGG